MYVLNRDTASRLAISSPLEAHKSHAIIFHTCGVDVGFDNPIFAVRETLKSPSMTAMTGYQESDRRPPKLAEKARLSADQIDINDVKDSVFPAKFPTFRHGKPTRVYFSPPLLPVLQGILASSLDLRCLLPCHSLPSGRTVLSPYIREIFHVPHNDLRCSDTPMQTK